MNCMVVVALLGALAVSGCVSSSSVDCGNGVVCAHDKQCATVNGQALCVERSQLGCTPGELCDNGAGSCFDGVCLPNECGNGRQDLNEVCDDDNTAAGDGCSALCDSKEVCGNSIIDGATGEQCDTGVPGLSGDGCTSSCTVEALGWMDVTPGPIPKRAGHTAAYDPSRQVVVAFGGYDESKLLGDTWEWDGGRWTKRVLGRSPPARALQGMAWNGQHVMIFGGAASSLLNDTWELVDDTWVQRQPVTAPEPRMFPLMAYDSARNKVVLFGGVDLAHMTIYTDTWLWDATNGTWEKKTTSAFPPDGANGVMAYDAQKQAVIWYGSAGFNSRQTWAWDGSSWAQVTTATLPSDSEYDVMVYEDATHLVVMTGEDSNNEETWTFNGTDWSKASANTGLSARSGMAAAYDASQGVIILLGGSEYVGSSSQVFGDTYEWKLSAGWSLIPESSVFPLPRGGHPLAYDSRHGVGVLFGGVEDVRTSVLGDTWIWRDGSWLQLSPATTPPPRTNHSITYDSGRDRVVMFGGADNDYAQANEPFNAYADTWELDVGAVSWVQKSAGPNPPARRHAAMAYDVETSRVVLFGGATYDAIGGTTNYFNDTWNWDGTSWTQAVPGTSPPAREGAAMAYDPVRKRVVMFGGSIGAFSPLLGDLWEWDGATWNQVSAASAPEARWDATMTYDPYRQRIVLAFGRGAAGFFDDTWEWDGSAWTRLLEHGGTGPRSAAFYDDVDNQLVTFGGFSYVAARADTLALGYRTPTTPRETCIVPGADDDNDKLVGCDDPDCWARCQPLCPPGMATCPSMAPKCGDGACGAVENHALCPGDCP